MTLDDSTRDALDFARVEWADLAVPAAEARDRALFASRDRSRAYYHRHATACRTRARERQAAKRRARGAKVGADKKLTATLRAEIVASTERGSVLAKVYGVSASAISWIRKHWKAAQAAENA